VDWDEQLFAVFDELEQQAEALYDADREAELVDRGRAEYASVTLASRLMASTDGELVLDVAGVGRVEGRLQRVGTGWCLLHGVSGDWVVPLAAVESVTGASDRSVPEVAWSPLTRLGLGSALRRLADEGARCLLHLRDGSRHEGTVGRVGADFAELTGPGGRVVLVPFGGLGAVQSRD
jgi:hypothetical protein